MSEEKDDKTKGSVPSAAPPQNKPVNDKPADAGKRPYATIDLKATEVPSTSGVPKVEQPANATKSAGATPDAGASASAAGAAAGVGTGGSTARPVPPPQAAKSATGSSGSAGPALPKSSTPPNALGAALSWLPSLAAGAAGAVIAMLGLGSMGLIGGDSNGQLGERLAVIESAAKSGQPATDVARQIAAAEARLGKIEQMTRGMADAQAALTSDAKALDARLATQTPAASAAADRLQKLEEQLGILSAAADNDPQRGRIPALAQITAKLGELDTQLTTRSASLKTEFSQELERRLTQSAETAETARARLAQRTQSLEQTLKSVSDDATALRTALDGLKGDVDTRLKAAAKPADVTAAIEPVQSKVAGLEKSLAGVVRSEQDRNATAGNILLSIELGNLKRALDRGGKYAAELVAVKKVGGDKLNLSVLEQAQNTGVPSIATLTTEFRTLAYTMLDAESEPADGSVMERLLAGAKSVVRVRKVAHGANDTGAEAVIGRMEASLKEGRLGDVLEEAKKLPEKPKAVAVPWLQKIEARYQIETAVSDLEQGLKNALAGSADVKKGAN